MAIPKHYNLISKQYEYCAVYSNTLIVLNLVSDPKAWDIRDTTGIS